MPTSSLTGSNRVQERNRSWLLAGLAAACLLITGCASSTESEAQLNQTGVQRAESTPAQNEQWDKLGYRLQWRAFATVRGGAGGSSGHITFFAPLGDVLVAQDSSSDITVIEANSGSRRWSDRVGSPLIRCYGAVRDQKRLIASTESEVLFFDIETGTLSTKQKLADVATTAPAQVGEVLVFGTASNVVLGHHLRSGYRLWGTLMNAPTEVAPIAVGPDGIVGMVSREGDVAFTSAATGTTVGRGKIFDGPNAELAASDTVMFIASRDHSLYAFTREGGSQLWRIRTEAPLRWSPTYIDGTVYCDLGADGLSAIDATTGNVLWNNKRIAGHVVVLNKGRLLVFDGSRASTLDAKDGSLVETVVLQDTHFLVADSVKGGSLYAVSSGGVIAKITGKP